MAESLARSLIRLIVTIAILGAAYLFIVRPVLDTTNHAIDITAGAFQGSQELTDQISETFDDAGFDDVDLNLESQQEAQRMLNCVQRAGQDVDRLERCTKRARQN
jgi:hypothetical protein